MNHTLHLRRYQRLRIAFTRRVVRRRRPLLATLPCVAEPCPHDRDEATCEYRSYTHASKCPSSQSPHSVRTGSVSWHRDSGYPKEVTAERVNASEEVIDEFYDKSTKRERMNLRRRPHLHKLDIEDESDDENDDSDQTQA